MVMIESQGFYVKVIADSENDYQQRLTSLECRYPRFIHSEVLTHRDRARNSASSRAIPWKKWTSDKDRKLVPNCMFAMIDSDPFVPLVFGKEQKGMQTGDALTGMEEMLARNIWINAKNDALAWADRLAELGVHKSICNRLTEPFMWITTLISATRWKNLFRLRVHPDAEVHFQKIAGMMKEALDQSSPKRIRFGDYHLPYVMENHPDTEVLKKVSAARCARLSYLTHDGEHSVESDLKLFARLIERDDDVIHASPLEHVAQSAGFGVQSGPYQGWRQFRKEYHNEDLRG